MTEKLYCKPVSKMSELFRMYYRIGDTV